MGRPRDYYVKLRAMASVGASIETIANQIGANSSRSFRRTLEKDPRAKNAFDQGRGEMESELVGALFRQATDPKNKTPLPATFRLIAMRGVIDQPQQQQAGNRVEVTFQLPAPLDQEEYKKLIEVTPRRALKDVNKDAA